MPNQRLPPEISQKVEFLSQPTSYPHHPNQVERIETHMSWVFLVDDYVYKLKKPVRSEVLDFTTVAARRHNCQTEVRLNRRLAPQVYLGIESLRMDISGNLHLGNSGQAVDWLVHMRRLPAEGMLDHGIEQGTVRETDLEPVVRRLTRFYQQTPLEPLSEQTYRHRIEADLRDLRGELEEAKPFSQEDISPIITPQLELLQGEPELFKHRVAQHIVEGHGDLRPQHICLRPETAIIDCLEFNRALRILDPADELAFLWLECERLGAAWIGEWIFTSYCKISGDWPPPRLVSFYKAYRACLRAKLAVRHSHDPGQQDADYWYGRSRTYLQLAQRYLAGF